MARPSPAQKLTRIHKVITAWQGMARNHSFGGVTFAQLKVAAQASLNAREEIKDMQRRRRITLKRRNVADAHTFKLITRVGLAVKDDPRHCNDSGLC